MSVENLEQSHSVQVMANFDATYTQLRDIIGEREVCAANVTLFVMNAMKLVENVAKQSHDHGAAKKALVLRLIERLVEDSDVEPDNKSAIMLIIDQLVPPLIEGLLQANNGELLQRATRWCRLTCCGPTRE